MQAQRKEFFQRVVDHAQKSPTAFPDPANRKKRVLEELPLAPLPPPKAMSKAEAKAQQKADLHALNILKTRLQPIMDQINRKYKKFRQPVIQYSQVQYLFDEADPSFVRPDVVEGQVRPFEIGQDRDGVDGLKEVATGKFFYNLETTTIEERLSNGFYSRPRDFYKDIERLAKDAKNIGDKERTLKANELVTNVEVDIHDIEIQLSNVNWEELHQRQVKRIKDQAEKAKKRAAMQNVIGIIQSDLSGDIDSDSQGPVRIGAAVPGPLTTAARFQPMSPRLGIDVPASGSHGLTNGSSVPSRQEAEDVRMSGVDDETQATNGTMRPPAFLPRPSSQQGSGARYPGPGAISQVSAVTSVPLGLSPSAIANDASTTRSTNESSKKSLTSESQQTNGVHNSGPPASAADNGEQGSQSSPLPDTQPGDKASGHSESSSSGKPWPHSQAHGLQQGLLGGYGADDSGKTSPTSSQMPRGFEAQSRGVQPAAGGPAALRSAAMSRYTPSDAPPTAIGALDNSGSSSSPSDPYVPNSLRPSDIASSSERNSSTPSQPLQRLNNEVMVDRFLSSLVEHTSGCSVEQLEQINRDLMDEIWRSRGEWNRTKVVTALTGVFNETIKDIEVSQGVRPNSQEEADMIAQDEDDEEEEEFDEHHEHGTYGAAGNGSAMQVGGKARGRQSWITLH
jgi:ATPase family AAA domain-containing protein 2